MELEKKFAEAIKENNAAMEAKMNELREAVEKGAKSEDIDALKSAIDAYKADNAKMQEQLDRIATNLKKNDETKVHPGNAIEVTVEKHLEAIAAVSKTRPVNVEGEGKTFFTKDNMILGNNLTGDQPRDYNFDVVRRPNEIANVEDLARTINISGGTYTFVRQTLTSGSPTVTTQTEGSDKAQLEYDITMVDANTDFIAGFVVYSKKMRNNLPFLQSSLAMDLRQDYYRGENTVFQAILASDTTASTLTTSDGNKIEMLVKEVSTLAGSNFMANGIVVTPSDYYDILLTEKSTGAGYGLPGVVTFEGGQLRINGIPIFMANWIPANKYYVGDWSRVTKVVTEGFSFAVSEEDEDNFRKNNITARVECQCTLAVEQPAAVIYGDFTAT